jgi:putative multicomponent Na+:H+ antiporter subunit B
MYWHTVLVVMITMNESYIYVITALLPLSALMLVLQVNPYHALVIQGISGAIAALVFALLGAADVALTQALMGTLLGIILYAVTVRSSMVMRLGVLQDEDSQAENEVPGHFQQLLDELRAIARKRHMRLELVEYNNNETLHQALIDKEIHATCVKRSPWTEETQEQLYHTAIRVRRVYEIMQAELASSATILSYVNTPNSQEKH